MSKRASTEIFNLIFVIFFLCKSDRIKILIIVELRDFKQNNTNINWIVMWSYAV